MARFFPSSGRVRATAAWLALATATPALGATIQFDWPHFNLTWPPSTPDMLLIGSGVIMILALGFALTRRHSRTPPAPHGHDLRWWKNPAD